MFTLSNGRSAYELAQILAFHRRAKHLEYTFNLFIASGIPNLQLHQSHTQENAVDFFSKTLSLYIRGSSTIFRIYMYTRVPSNVLYIMNRHTKPHVHTYWYLTYAYIYTYKSQWEFTHWEAQCSMSLNTFPAIWIIFPVGFDNILNRTSKQLIHVDSWFYVSSANRWSGEEL